MRFKLFDPPALTGKYLAEVLASKWLTMGPMCERLQDRLAEYFKRDKDCVVLAGSATVGFQAVMDHLVTHRRGFGDGTWVEIRKDTWPGMRQAVRHAGLELGGTVPAKILVHTDIGGAEPAPKPPQDKLNTWFIHDACHSWRPIVWADFAVMSFYPTKLVAGAEGGVVLCSSAYRAADLRLRLNCGLAPAHGAGAKRLLYPEVEGRKGNMTDVQAALNLEALELAPAYMAEIAASWEIMRFAATTYDLEYRYQPLQPYLFQVEVEGRDRVPEVRLELERLGVPSAWNFPPNRYVTLPLYPGLKVSEANEIMAAARKAIDAVCKEAV